MAATYAQYASWGPEMQARYRARYGSAPKRPTASTNPSNPGFTPFVQPTRPAPGYYDPAIDAQERAGQRGYDYTAEDIGTANQRGQQDFASGTQDIQTQRDQSLADLLRQHQRDLTDIGTGQTRATQDHATSIADLIRNYARLGTNQRQAGAAAGLQDGGFAAQAARKRAANEAHDQAPIDQAFGRYMADSNQTLARANEDYSLQAGDGSSGGRIRDAADRAIAQLGLGFGRQTDDWATQLSRAGIELGQQNLDLGQTRDFQAQQAGYIAPERPANEHTDPRTGQVFRLIRQKSGNLVRLLPNGQLVRRPRYSLRG